jgi:hypothetical protein
MSRFQQSLHQQTSHNHLSIIQIISSTPVAVLGMGGADHHSPPAGHGWEWTGAVMRDCLCTPKSPHTPYCVQASGATPYRLHVQRKARL